MLHIDDLLWVKVGLDEEELAIARRISVVPAYEFDPPEISSC
jgi:hypothetical protein